ncbi:hypothetical protein BX600DRAFT_72251 [Xylariales sp. PMI_506]|nr:hypothetical protein BX600DRAFT_72251 [Xylariales sp. PMI_506]
MQSSKVSPGFQTAAAGEIGEDTEIQDAEDDELERYLLGDAADQKSEMSAALGQVSHIVDCLLRLSVTISNPAPYDQFKSRVGFAAIGYFEPWDIQYVREKFSRSDPVILQRLGVALTRRRHYFKYLEEHHSRLAKGLDDPDNAVDAGERTTIAPSVPGDLKDKHDGVSVKEDIEIIDMQSESSNTAYVPSAKDDSELREPRIPMAYLEGPFLCPFCHAMIEVNSRATWKKHVFRDLRPYVCLETSCQVLDNEYQLRSDWKSHMRQEHWNSWPCPFGCSQIFDTASAFRDHVISTHKDTTEATISTLKTLVGQPDLAKSIGPCPLCLDFHINTAAQYDSHVAAHLEQIALFALPKLDGGDEDTDETDSEMDSLASFASGAPATNLGALDIDIEGDTAIVDGKGIGSSPISHKRPYADSRTEEDYIKQDPELYGLRRKAKRNTSPYSGEDHDNEDSATETP